MTAPLPDVNVNINCNSDCHKCCPKKLKFFCFCWCCTCGCQDVIEEKIKDVAEKSISRQTSSGVNLSKTHNCSKQ